MKDKEIRIIDYTPEHKPDSIKISEEWINRSYVMEQADRDELYDPEKYILNDGGAIIMATSNGEIAGTCAMQNNGNGEFEMIKMGVYEKYRGLGIGRKLCQGIIDKAIEQCGKRMILHSNTKGSTLAIELYRKFGFIEVPVKDAIWERADIRMELELKAPEKDHKK